MRRYSVTRILRKLSKASTDKIDIEAANAKQSISRNDETPPRSDRSCNSQPGLFTLATELQMEIIAHLAFVDLCALRLTCRQAVSMLLSSSDILSHWVQHSGNISPLQQRLYPPPSNQITFTYILEQHHRLFIASQLSVTLGHYVQQHILVYLKVLDRPLRSLLRGLDGVWHPIDGEVAPLLLILQHYLESVSKLWLTLPTTPVPPPQDFNEMFSIAERKVFSSSYTLEEIRDANKLWLFLCWTTKQLLNRPSYVGSIERGLRGWTESPVSDEDFRTYILFTNIRGLLALLRMKTYRERRKNVNAVISSLDPQRNIYKWRESWKSLSLSLNDPGPTDLQVEGALVMKRGHHAIWTKFARQILVEKGMLGDWHEMLAPIGSARQTVEFLRDVCGYRFMLTANAMAQLSEVGAMQQEADDGDIDGDQGDASAD